MIMELQIILYLGNFSWETLLCGVPRFLAACLQRGPLGYCFRSPEPYQTSTLMVSKHSQLTSVYCCSDVYDRPLVFIFFFYSFGCGLTGKLHTDRP